MLVKHLSFIFLLSINILSAEAIRLYQKDFDEGTYLIDKPGTYVLAEDIVFNPNSVSKLKTDAYGAGFPLKSQFKSAGGKYEDKPFGIGFFAAISIFANDVTLDLNGHTIEQGREHALQQRFFAVLELANQPFIHGQGPHDFGAKLIPSKKIVIKNGNIGLSSHHGIHGNGNEDVLIKNIHFKDFEVAAVALNGVHGLKIENCTATNRTDIPVLGTFSAARFIQPYLDYLEEIDSKTTLNIGGNETLTISDVKKRLRKAIDSVFEDLIVNKRQTIDPNFHPTEFALFHNSHQVIDGNCYGFLVNALGQAVEGFPVHSAQTPGELAKNIHMKNVVVKGITGKVTEVIGIKNGDKSMVDPVGAVFQIKNVNSETGQPVTVSSLNDAEAVYTGNPVANAQALVAKAHLNGEFKGSKLDVTRLNITQPVIDWIEANPSTPQSKLTHLLSTTEGYICNGDSMFHVNKGVVGFKIDATDNVLLENTRCENITNLSEVGSDLCGVYVKSHPKATLIGCGGPKTRGYSIAGSSKVKIKHCTATDISARCGSAVAFDILTDSSKILIENTLVERVYAGSEFKHNEAPNEPPKAIGFRISKNARNISLSNVCALQLKGYGQSEPVLDESNRARVKLNCQLEYNYR